MRQARTAVASQWTPGCRYSLPLGAIHLAVGAAAPDEPRPAPQVMSHCKCGMYEAPMRDRVIDTACAAHANAVGR